MDRLLERRVSRRDALRGFGGGLAVLGLGGGLAACGGGSDSGGGGSSSALTAWNYHPELKASYDELTKAFAAAHRDIDLSVSYKPAAQYETVLKTALVGGTAPDLISVNSSEIRGDLGVRGGYIAPLDKQVNVGDFSETLHSVIAFDGHTWAVPLQALRIGLYYQKGIFDQHGLKPPTTWDELKSVCRTLKDKGVAAISQPAQDMILPFFFYELAAASILGPDGFDRLRTGQVKLTDAELLPAAQLFADLAPYYIDGFQALAFAEGKALFAQGRAAMIVGGTSDYAAFKEVNPNIDVGFIGFPTPDGAPAVDLSGFSFGFTVNKKAKNLAAAQTFAQWAASEEAQRVVLDKIGLPARKGLTPSGSDARSVVLRDALAVAETPFWLDYPETAGTLTAATKSGSGLFTGKLNPQSYASLIQGAIAPSQS